MIELLDYATRTLPILLLAIATGLYAGRTFTRLKTEGYTGVWK